MRGVLLLSFICSYLSIAQSSKQLRDSVLKYKTTNPSLAVKFGLEYDLLTSDRKPDKEKQNTYALLGEILIEMGLYASSLDYLNNSVQIYNALPKSDKNFPEIDQPPWVILNIGSIYFKNRDYEKAAEKYQQAITLFEKIGDKNAKFYGLNTANSNLGLIEERKGNYKKAEEIYYQIYQRRLEKGKKEDILYSIAQLMTVKLLQGDELSAQNKLNEAESAYQTSDKKQDNSLLTRNWGYVQLVYGAYYQSVKKYDLALTYLFKAKEILKAFPSEIHALGSRIAECYLGLENFKEAERVANENLKIKNLNDTEKKYNFKVLEKIYKHEGQDSKLLNIKDSLILIFSGASNSKIFSTLNSFENQIQIANTAKEINENKIKYNTYIYILIICSLILFFSLITIRISYNLQKEKGSRLEIEKKAVISKLEEKNRELVSKTNFIIQRNDYLKKIKKEMNSGKVDSKTSINRLSKELDLVIRSEKYYSDFDKMFVEVYPDFYNKLNASATLSQTDLRLASYIKMNHTNNEIASISGISLRTVESQRYRLSKKLNLGKDQNLNSFLLSI
jgi:tetratricopeptide (TPR) repeat protein